MRLKKGDIVQSICGEYRGKQGKILRVSPTKQSCIVEGINFQIKHQRPTSPGQQAGRLKKEGWIQNTNLKLVCPKCGLPTRISKKKIGDKFVRVCKKCGEMIEE
ncbi:50S ribosomal protein L24 [candidate division WOR-3 bacterium]|nr:50S ribosomal protein L24 [candidate division WOR-3 bacterium]